MYDYCIKDLFDQPLQSYFAQTPKRHTRDHVEAERTDHTRLRNPSRGVMT